MFLFCLMLMFAAGFALILAFSPTQISRRPTLMLDMQNDPLTGMPNPIMERKEKTIGENILLFLRKFSFFNKPLAASPTGRRIYRDLSMARAHINTEEFFLIKQVLIALFVTLAFMYGSGDFFMFLILMGIAAGYMLPELWLKAKTKKTKDSLLRELPDTVDLLGLCVNAGLDFMMALKYVVDKSHPSVLVEELRNMMQEINVGKPRRDALRDLAKKYEMPDLSTFSRTLIQADRMGTSVSEALNILSEDMRETRFRRGEALALKAPLKMLIPLLFFIFPVVAILVAGPIFLDFFQNNPIENIGK